MQRFFVLHRDGRSSIQGNCLYRSADGQLCVWNNEDVAIKHADKFSNDRQAWRVRLADPKDFIPSKHLRRNQTISKYLEMDKETVVAKKTTSKGLLVEVFEDIESRRFAVSSRASTENEFIVEVAEAISSNASTDWNTRLRELLPLVVDLCCKYRGYKAESVHERRELIAGDLEVPRTHTA